MSSEIVCNESKIQMIFGSTKPTKKKLVVKNVNALLCVLKNGC